MTLKQISDMIEYHNLGYVRIQTYNNDLVFEPKTKNAQAVVNELAENAPMLKEYSKLEVMAKKDNDTPWSKAFVWQLSFPKADEGKAVTVAGMPDNSLIAGIYDKMFQIQKSASEEKLSLMEKMMSMNTEVFKVQNQTNMINGAMPWLAGMMGWKPEDIAKFSAMQQMQMQPNKVAGIPGMHTSANAGATVPLTSEQINKLTEDERNTKINEELEALTKNIKGSEMLALLNRMNTDPQARLMALQFLTPSANGEQKKEEEKK